MFTKVSVLVPTRGRVARLRTLLDSYDATTFGELSELVFRIDEDDEATREFFQFSRHRVIVGPRGKGYGDMPTFFNELARSSMGDVLLCGNDDMVFKTVGWASLILQAANQYPDGLFNLGVSTFNEDHYPFSTVSKHVVDKLGFLWDPRIFWGDIYLRDVMGCLGRLEKLPGVVIDHDWAGNDPDRTFEESDKDIVCRVPDYWTVVHAQAVAEAVEKLKELHHVGR
jgi:hypothetical protein